MKRFEDERKQKQKKTAKKKMYSVINQMASNFTVSRARVYKGKLSREIEDIQKDRLYWKYIFFLLVVLTWRLFTRKCKVC